MSTPSFPRTRAKSIQDSLDEQTGNRAGFATVIRHAQAFAALDRRIAEAIPEQLRSRIGVACVREDCLVIAAREAAAATRARLLAPRLLELAAAHWPRPLKHWRVIVTPDIEFDRAE
ncbi:MAG: hypothetical protein CVV18_07040 [Gammaproteobacteria bacterium HGW-Gammaproteobacteria-8]|nr:MAG: hypothetical protein CVV18_07040 [Gammaproteobacteria bacterium HGW-Gammaproteobacteria-8]